MNLFTHTLLCCALLFVTLKELTEACSCAKSHPQKHFCDAEVVLRARITGEESAGSADSMRSYKIEVIKQFKGSEKMNQIQHVKTPSQSAACGVILQVNKEYLLAGSSSDGTFRVFMCGFNKVWQDLPDFQKNAFSNGYALGCECEIKMCNTETCEKPATNECLWKDTNSETIAKQHMCIKGKNGSCGWSPSITDKPSYANHP